MPLLLTDVIDRADVGMIQRRSGLSLPPEAGQRLRVAGDILGQELERDETVQPGVLGLITTPIPPPPSFSTTR
jgi:hypothetical protein